jgi:alkanesulfonate monooxygenase SsuD/methylene tetrahydromethanopterin reductase-like flavin-dependent oxidoreductase (luciferase family)
MHAPLPPEACAKDGLGSSDATGGANVKFGAQFLAEDFHDCMESVQVAERAGFSHAWFVDSQILWQDCYVYMAQALAMTERIVLGTAVSNPFTRHPTVTASVNATLAELYPGRLIVGLGRGDSAVRTMGLNPVPTKELRAAVPVIRALMAGETTEINDAEVHFRWRKEGPPVPIALSATGPKNLRAAGALADIVMIYVGVHPENVSWAINHIRAGAADAGRDPDSVKVSVLCGLEVSDDRAAAQDAVRWAAAACANHIGDTMTRNPAHGMPATMTRLVDARIQHYDYYEGHLDSGADHTAFLTPELIDDFAIAGPPEHCLEMIQALAELGVWEVSSAYYNGRNDQLERVGREVIGPLQA